MQKKKIYTIYAHSDTDGGIAAAMMVKFINEKYGKYGWITHVVPVNHGHFPTEWGLQEIQWPCAILDFTLHPSYLNFRFFQKADELLRAGVSTAEIPECFWIDHHATGSSFPFLTEENLSELMPGVKAIWDQTAASTPGLMRKCYKELGISKSLIDSFEEMINVAEIVDAALYATCEAAHDFSSPVVRLQQLFNSNFHLINKDNLYRDLVFKISKNPCLEDILDDGFLYNGILQYEEFEQGKLLKFYKKYTTLKGKVAVSNFIDCKERVSLGRFLPYLLFPKSQFAVHVMPKGKQICSLSCGVNPWNKPTEQKHIGNYFANHFQGGGHPFVAGGKMNTNEIAKINALVSYLNESS